MARCNDFSCSDEEIILRNQTKIISARKRRIKRGLVIFAIIVPVLMLLSVTSPAVQAITEEYVDDYAYELPSSGSDDNEYTSRFHLFEESYSNESIEVETPEYIRPHETRSYYTPIEPYKSSAGEFSLPIIFSETEDSYSYNCTFGVYNFMKSDPSILIVEDHFKQQLASANFNIESDHEIVLGKAEIVDSNMTKFTTSQLLNYDGCIIGKFFVMTEIFESKNPKISAWLHTAISIERLSFAISWNIELPIRNVKIDNDIFGISEIANLNLSSNNSLLFEIGTGNEADQWEMECRIDWTDAKCGELSFQNNMNNIIARVLFPSGMDFVDPTIVGTANVNYATPGSPFRNVVYHDGTYWLFYQTGAYIKYAYSTNGGLDWSGIINLLFVPDILKDYGAFDVAIENNRIAVSWVEEEMGSLYDIGFIDGTISGKIINWNSAIYVVTNINTVFHFGGVALTANGSAFISYSYIFSVGHTDYWSVTTLKKIGGSSFSEFYNPFQNVISNEYWNVQPRIISQPQGNIVLLVNYYDPIEGSELHWDIYFPSMEVWEADPPWETDLSIDNHKDFSATHWKNNKTVFLLRMPDGLLRCKFLQQGEEYWVYNVDLEQPGVFRAEGSWPSISVDMNRQIHIQFINNSEIYEMHNGQNETSWSDPIMMFPDDDDIPVGLSSGEKLYTRTFVSYTNTKLSTKKIMFCALPLPIDSTIPYGDPWSTAGIGQDQPFDVGLADVISPGNGLLYLFQTDFTIPGRGVDTIASRFFATPQYFIENSTGKLVPYLYEEFPYCNMGEGWQLNLPWIEGEKLSYVYLWGGSKIAIKWDGDVFNNTKGQPFTLYRTWYMGDPWYTLDLPDGMRIVFWPHGAPAGIYHNRILDDFFDPQKIPDIEFLYNLDITQLLRIRDTYLNRTIYFNYSDVDMLQTIEYMGKNVTFEYDENNRLISTTDPLERTTSFEYYSNPTPQILLKTIFYPTGSSCGYQYDNIQVGTDAYAYVVSHKITPNNHRTIYSYTAMDGAIKYTQIDDYGLNGNWRLKGSTEYNFDSNSKNVVVTYFEVDESYNLIPMKRTVSWYSPDGRISRAETFYDFRSSPDVVTAEMDNKGNMIYSKDPIGHEVFSSFANTNMRNAFHRPAQLKRDTSGKIFFDDFNDWIDDGWIYSSSAYAFVDEYMNYDLDPNLEVWGTSTPYYCAVKLDLQGNGYEEVIVDFLAMLDSSNDDVRFVLGNGFDYVVAGVRFYNGVIYYGNAGYWTSTGQNFAPEVIYRITLHVKSQGIGTFVKLYLDGSHLTDFTPSAYPLKYFRVDVQNLGDYYGPIIDNVKIFKDWDIVINGLESGQFVEIFDSKGEFVDRKKASGSSVTFELNSTHEFIPYGDIIVRNKTDVIEIIDTYREIWGGDIYQYSKPEFLKCAIKKTSSGFDSASGFIMDDEIPERWESIYEPFIFETDGNFTIFGEKYHHGGVSSDERSYGAKNSSTQYNPDEWPSLENDEGFFVQYVYLPNEFYPLYISFHPFAQAYDPQTGFWGGMHVKYAYWGFGTWFDYTNSKRMGDLPPPKKWTMLVVNASDINWGDNDPGWLITGMYFRYQAGDVYYDKTAFTSDLDFGKIKMTGLSEGKKVEIRKSDGSLITSDTIVSGDTAKLDLYAAGMTSFPISGYFSIYNSTGKLEYESPVFNDIYTNDTYAYDRSESPFYSNPPVPIGFGKLAVGIMQYLDSAETKLMESYMKYGPIVNGYEIPNLISEQKAKNGTGWLTTKYTYDEFGNTLTVTDPTGAILNYSYVLNGTYLGSSWILVGDQNISQIYNYYDSGSKYGLLKNETDALGRTTEYEYDDIGRVTRIVYPKIDGETVSIRYEYNDTNRIEIFYDENGTARKTYYDSYGRVQKIERLRSDNSIYSYRHYYYQWDGKVDELKNSDYKMFYYEYDYLGRITKISNPDTSYIKTIYDDKNRTVITYDEESRRKDMVYDANDRLIQSIQYLGSTKLYTNITYDEIGNILTVTDCMGLTTSYEYDNLGRCTKTTFPDGNYEQYWYDDASRILEKKKKHRILHEGPGGYSDIDFWLTTHYDYDIAGRLLNYSFYGTPINYYNGWKNYSYDENGNILTVTYAEYLESELRTLITTEYEYDAWNRISNETNWINGEDNAHIINYTYDNRSNIEEIQLFQFEIEYPEDPLFIHGVNYSYDEFNRPIKVRYLGDRPQYDRDVAWLTYNNRDQLTSISYYTGIITNYTLDSYRGWIDRIQTKDGAQILLDLEYERDDTGKILTINTDRTYVYDSIGRLSYANDTDVYGNLAYTYDIFGNRLNFSWGSTTTNYSYDQYGRLERLENSTDTISYNYDPAGKLSHKNDGTYYWTYIYDVDDRLIEVLRNNVTIEEYFYDALGRRVKSIQNSVSEITIYSGSTPLFIIKESPSPDEVHFFANNIHLAKRLSKTAWFYYHQDHSGSTRIVTDWRGHVNFDTDYLPFGLPYDSDGTEEFLFVDSRTSSISGLVHFGARYYDSEVGRFISPDRVMGALSIPSSLNRYVYCKNDPVNRIDLDGNWDLWGSICDIGSSIVDVAVDFVGNVGEAIYDGIVWVADAAGDVVDWLADKAGEVWDAIVDAGDAIADAIVSVGKAIQKAWDSLDAGLKQWIIIGISIAACIALPGIGGILVSCVLDGTFIDMFTAVATGNWAMLGLSLACMVPGMKALKATKAIKKINKLVPMKGTAHHLSHAKDLGLKNVKQLDKYGRKTLKNTISKQGASAKFFKSEKALAIETKNLGGGNVRIIVHAEASQGRGAMGTVMKTTKPISSSFQEIEYNEFLEAFI